MEDKKIYETDLKEMHAWEIATKFTTEAVPKLQKEEELDWTDTKVSIGDMDIADTRARWYTEVPGSRAPDFVFIGGIQAMGNRGYDVSEAEALIPETHKAWLENDNVTLLKNTAKIFEILGRAPKIPDHPYWSYKYYDSFEDHKADVHFPVYQMPYISDEEMLEKLHAGWQAQIAGAAVGTILEGYTTDQIRAKFGEVWDYLRKPSTYNDDVLFEIAFLEAFKQKGYAVTSEDIGLEWIGRIEYTWSGEEVAFKNMKRGIFPPESAKVNNPWNEWIGAQMRGSICGMVAPGDPFMAAKLAWTDGTISHINNGVLGEVFNAILCSLAFVKSDVREILYETVNLMPKKSEYYSVVKFALDACEANTEWEPAWRACEEKYKKYNWIHTYPNAAAQVVALYFGSESFDECMHICAMCGQDVDCNAGQIGTIYGIIGGYDAIDKKWTEPFGDQFDSLVRGYEHTTVKALAQLTLDSIKKASKK